MTLKLANLQAEIKRVTLEYQGEELNVAYRPKAVTSSTMDMVGAEVAGDRGDRALLALLEAVLVSWDLLDDDGEALPTTRDVLATLPLDFLGFVMQGVQGDMNPSGEAGASFSAG